jgi:methionyl aminopeptidase
VAGPGVNDPCWCGSGIKYKKCHRLRDAPVKPGVVGPMREVPPEIERPPYIATDGYPRGRDEPLVKPPEIVAAMRKAGLAAGEVLDIVGAAVAPGVTTDELDRVAHEAYIERGGYPSPLGYKGFTKGVCTSVNEVICHGIPDDRPLGDGEIVNVDVTIFLDGVHGDTNATFGVGEIDARSTELIRVTKESLYLGIEAVRPGAPVWAIGRAIQEHAEGRGFGVVRSFCGHAIGREFHGALSIPHYEEPAMSLRLEPGMTFTIEPMITIGSYRERLWSDGWTAVTSDGLRTAQFEHTIVVTDDGAEILTPSGALAREAASH